MRILAIDPGPTKSTYVIWDGVRLEEFQELSNNDMLEKLLSHMFGTKGAAPLDNLVIEQIRGYGMRVGNETFDTCHWAGRFHQLFGDQNTVLMPRKTVCLHLCGQASPGDKFIRQALLDKFGGPDSIKRGGPLYKVTGDTWAALAVAITWYEQNAAAK